MTEPLKRGDLFHIVAASSPITKKEDIHSGIKVLQEWGLICNHINMVNRSWGYLAGSDEVRFNDPSSFVLVQRIMKDCSIEEKDALISIVNKEQPDEFAERYNINYANAVQKRRRAINKIRERLFSNNVEKSYA